MKVRKIKDLPSALFLEPGDANLLRVCFVVGEGTHFVFNGESHSSETPASSLPHF